MNYNNYLCPDCKGQIKVGDYIILSTETPGKKRGLVLLHPELGNYTVKSHPDFSYKEGEQLRFYCPICHSDLTVKKNRNLACVILQTRDEKEFEIFFSQVAGEKSTFQLIGDSMKVFGDDSQKYLDFFNLSQMS